MSACIEYCNTLQHTATHCNTLQRTATHCNTLQRTTTHYIILYNTANTFNALKIMSSACIEYINTCRHWTYGLRINTYSIYAGLHVLIRIEHIIMCL